MIQISIAQAEAEFDALVAQAEAGLEVVITRDGVPVARVAPLQKPPPIVFGDLSHLSLPDELSLPEDVIGSIYPADFPKV